MALIMDMPELKVLELKVGGWPGGTVTAMTCEYPEAPDGGIDLSTRETCVEHQRTIWWCLNTSQFWCDGGPPDYAYHFCVFTRMEDLPY